MSFSHFDPSIIEYLKRLKQNNNKEWFNDHKQEYEDDYKTPQDAAQKNVWLGE